MDSKPVNIVFFLCLTILVTCSKEIDKDQVDRVMEDEITQKLSEDLLQSIEKKFNVDLEKSVDSVLSKIKLLLQNGSTHIQEKLGHLQSTLEAVKNETSDTVVEICLAALQNETTALAEKALHQMVVCGYALIGHDPAQAIRNVMDLKSMIKQGIKPVYEKRDEVHNLLRVCGHDHDTLKKVIKCVISKSPQLKSAMMDVSGKLIEGVVHLSKQMAHGAMHEACLIEVINTVEDEAFGIVDKVRSCATGSNSSKVETDMNQMLKENNATVLDVSRQDKVKKENKDAKEDLPVNQLNNILKDGSVQEGIDKSTKDLIKPDSGVEDDNVLAKKDGKNVDK